MARIIAVANQKGGVGKTTTSVNLAAALADMNYRTLLVDLDAQGNATVGCGVNPRELEKSAFDVMTKAHTVAEVTIHLEDLGLDLLPSNSDLTAAEFELMQAQDREYRLQSALELVAAQYGWIIIDCPPSLNLLTLNALTASSANIMRWKGWHPCWKPSSRSAPASTRVSRCSSRVRRASRAAL